MIHFILNILNSTVAFAKCKICLHNLYNTYFRVQIYLQRIGQYAGKNTSKKAADYNHKMPASILFLTHSKLITAAII